MGELQPWPGGGGGVGEVASVFGRKGAVVAQAGDYAVGQVTSAASIAQLNEGIEAAEKLAVGGDLAGNLPNPTIRAALKALIEGALQSGAAAGGDLTGTLPNPTIKVALRALIEGALQVGAAAGGDLTGTFPNATIGAKKVTDAKIEKPVVAGVVKANGEKEFGEGFTCSNLSAGLYKIELTTELATVGSLTCSTIGVTPIAQCQAAGKKIFEVRTVLPATSVLENARFTFQIKAT